MKVGVTMLVEVLSATENPTKVCSLGAGISWDKDNVSRSRLETCYNNDHHSIFEHATVTFRIFGISRACSAQLLRHRLMSPTEKSLRYTEPDENRWFTVPESIEKNPYFKAYLEFMDHAETLYSELLEHGIKKEDARYILPLATHTNVQVTMNMRELMHFFELRLAKNAQWEIRELAARMLDKLADRYSYTDDDQFFFSLLFNKYFEPARKELGAWMQD